MKIITTGFLILASLGFANSARAVELIHNPVLTAAVGEPVQISAVLSGADPSTRVRLYYRIKGKEQYSSVQMGGSPSQVDGTIPAKAVAMPGVEYYIEATLNGAVVASAPSMNAKLIPNFITVRKDETKPDLSVLSPMEGDEVETAQPVITVSYEDADSGLDLSSLLVKIDGIPIRDKGHVQALDTLMSYVPSADLAEGKHEATVVIKDKAGNIGSVKWEFTVKSKISSNQGQASAKSKFKWDGLLSYETMYGYVAQQPTQASAALPFKPYGANRAHVEVNGRGEVSTYQLKVYKTDEERSDQQASDRYTAMMTSDEGIIALGDYSPSFSTLSLYNPYFFRGVTLDLRSGDIREGHTRMMGVWGQTQRPVEAGAAGSSGAPASAAYGEYLYGTRWEFGSKYFGMGMNAVSVNDDVNSVNSVGSLTPKYSAVATSDAQIKIPQIFLVMSGEVGADYFMNGQTLLDVNAGNAYRAGADLNILPWGSHLNFDWKDLGGSFGFVPGGYNTMANPGLLPDYRGYESSYSQSAMQGQMGLSVNLNSWRDNLTGSKDLTSGTTRNDFISVFGNVAPNGLPYLNLGITQNLQKNDVDSVSNSLNASIDNVSTTYTLGLGYTKPINENTSLSGNFSYMNISFLDQAPLRLGQDMYNNNYVLSAFLTHNSSSFNVAGSMGFTNQPSCTFGFLTAAARTGNNDTVSVAWIQRWIPRVFDTRVSYDLAINHFESPAAGVFLASNSDTNRSTLSLGGNYTLKEVHRFGLSFAYAEVGSSSNYSGVSNSDTIGELLSDFNYNFTF